MLFYISIFILCILVWLNTKNKEGIENPNALIGLSVENLYNIYKTIDNTNREKVITKPSECPTKSEVIYQLRKLEIKDETFKELINPIDNKLDVAYDNLMKKLKNIPNIIYKRCNKQQDPKDVCPPLPVCNCLFDQDMCNNSKYLNYVFNDQLEPASILKIVNSGLYTNPTLSNVTDIKDLTDSKLKEFFFPLPK
jgi:hypothetical protein